MNKLISVSIPRSGHHLLMNLLWNYFQYGQFLHCEAYSYTECCKKIPCESIDKRAGLAFGDLNDLRLFIQKSHDLENEVSIDPSLTYLIQIRDPAQAAIGWLRWELTNWNTLSHSDIARAFFRYYAYYIKFYHKWCLDSQPSAPRNLVISYEELTGSRSGMRNAVLRFLRWVNMPIYDDRLAFALDKTLSIDSHTGESRNGDTKTYSIDYYDEICGGAFRYMLKMIAVLCPGIEFNKQSYALTTTNLGEQYFNDLFFPIDLTGSDSVKLDFTATSRKLHANSLVVASGCPSISPSFGVSSPESGLGAWTDGDIVILPFKLSAVMQSIAGKITFIPLEQVDVRSALHVYAVVEGAYVPIEMAFELHEKEWQLNFHFSAPIGRGTLRREGALILKFTQLNRFYTNDPRKLGLLLKNLVISGHI